MFVKSWKFSGDGCNQSAICYDNCYYYGASLFVDVNGRASRCFTIEAGHVWWEKEKNVHTGRIWILLGTPAGFGQGRFHLVMTQLEAWLSPIAQDCLLVFAHVQVQPQLSLLLLECAPVNYGLTESWLTRLLNVDTYNINLHLLWLESSFTASKSGFGETN